MSEIEKIERYISNTKIKTTKAGASVEDIIAIANGMDIFRAVSLAFMYGRAKGYRAAKTEARNA